MANEARSGEGRGASGEERGASGSDESATTRGGEPAGYGLRRGAKPLGDLARRQRGGRRLHHEQHLVLAGGVLCGTGLRLVAVYT